MNLTDYKTMLIAMDEGIGNMLDLTPAIRALKEINPDLQITVMGRYPALDIVKDTPFVSEVLTAPVGKKYEIGIFAIWYNYTLKAFQSEIVKSCNEMFVLDYNTPDRPEWWHYLEIPRLFGWSGSVANAFCAVSKCDVPLDASKLKVALADTAAIASKNKKWPYYSDLAHHLVNAGCQVVLVGSEEEANEFQIDKWPPTVVNLMGKLTVPECGYVFLQCDLMIGNDCGMAQMAAILDVPTLFIYGPTYVPKNYPLGKTIKILRRDLDCAPCQFTERWGKCLEWECLRRIRVEDVIRAINEWGVYS